MRDFEELDSKASHETEILNSWVRCVSRAFPHEDLTPFVNTRIPNTSLLAGYLILPLLLNILLFQKTRFFQYFFQVWPASTDCSQDWDKLYEETFQQLDWNIVSSITRILETLIDPWGAPTGIFQFRSQKVKFLLQAFLWQSNYQLSGRKLRVKMWFSSYVNVLHHQFLGANALIDILIQRPSRIKELKNAIHI